MRILIVGNSVSNPPFDGAPSYPRLLGEQLGAQATVITIIGSGETIEQLEARTIAALAGDVDRLVLQVGINECAPRPLSVSERAWLGRLRSDWLRKQIIRIIHRFRPQIIRVRGLRQVTPLPAFKASVARVVAAARERNIPVLILPITTVTAVAEARTPFTNREAARYNAALAAFSSAGVRVATQRDIFGTDEATGLVASPETVHLSPDSHRMMASFVQAWISMDTV